MPALNGKDRAAVRMLVAAVATLLALFVPPIGITSAAAGGAEPRAGSADPLRPAGARTIVSRQARGHTAPALVYGSVPPGVLPSVGLITAALNGSHVAATAVDHEPRWRQGRLPDSRAPPLTAG